MCGGSSAQRPFALCYRCVPSSAFHEIKTPATSKGQAGVDMLLERRRRRAAFPHGRRHSPPFVEVLSVNQENLHARIPLRYFTPAAVRSRHPADENIPPYCTQVQPGPQRNLFSAVAAACLWLQPRRPLQNWSLCYRPIVSFFMLQCGRAKFTNIEH